MAEKKVEDYTLLSSFDPRALMREVKEYLAKGWMFLGGVSTANETRGIQYCQSMVLYEGDLVEDDYHEDDY